MKIFGVWNDDERENIDTIKQDFGENNVQVQIGEEPLEEVGQIALDVLESHESVYILAPVAGIELADIDISVHETTLTISGIRNKPKEFYEHAMDIKNAECFWGRFTRKIILPENMDFSAVKAVMENNLLVIHIPKIRFDSQNIKINRIES